MKKLMIAAAAAAMIGGAFADAQVYEYKLNLKSTVCKEGKATKNTYWTKIAGFEAGDEISYRTKNSLVIQGLTWGCSCAEAVMGDWDVVCNKMQTTSYCGITFWYKKADEFLGGTYDGSVFTWEYLNRIGKKANEAEFTLTLEPGQNATDTNFELVLAGYGTITDNFVSDKDPTNPTLADCGSYIKSASGSVAGFVNPDQSKAGCTYCEDVTCDVYTFCDDASNCNNCTHGGFVSDDATKTVAFGTFTMKYNKSASSKLRKTSKISQSYSGFSKNVKAVLVALGE